jgi:hypothetical protein
MVSRAPRSSYPVVTWPFVAATKVGSDFSSPSSGAFSISLADGFDSVASFFADSISKEKYLMKYNALAVYRRENLDERGMNLKLAGF